MNNKSKLTIRNFVSQYRLPKLYYFNLILIIIILKAFKHQYCDEEDRSDCKNGTNAHCKRTSQAVGNWRYDSF